MAVRVVLVAVVLGCCWWVIGGTQPGDTRVAERHAIGKPAHVDDYIGYGFWYGCLFTGGAALLLLGTSRWWLNADAAGVKPITNHSQGIPTRRFMLLLGGILALSLVPRLPRMDDSFWGDEDWAYRDLIGGRFDTRAEDGSLGFKRHPWKVTAFWDKGANNQYAYTLTARVFHDAWKRASGAPPQEFSEAVLRIPSLLAGLGSIAMGALLLRRLGYNKGALLLAALLAIHPWHVRYSSEARGYTMLIFFLLAGIYFLVSALEDGRWRWWLLFALCEFLSLYTWKAAIHPIAAVNLGVFVFLLVQRRRELQQFARWVVVNIGVLMLFVPLFAPAIPQIHRKLAVSTQAKGEMGLKWFKDVWAELLGGADWIDLSPVSIFVLSAFVIVFGVLGLRRMIRDRNWIVILPVAGSLLAFLHFSLTGNVLLKWYVFYALPFLLLLVAVGLEIDKRVPWLVAIFLLFQLPILKVRMTEPLQYSRESAQVTRNAEEGRLHMGATDIVTVGLYRVSISYDPRMRQGRDLRSGEALMAVVEECRAEGKQLRVNAANLYYSRREHADFMVVLEDGSVFRRTGRFAGAESYLDIETYEMVEGPPGSSAEP